MLRTLSIRDFVIVDAIELEFAPGFSVFTGETGAGKSILIDALVLALGGRGDAGVVREGAARADISAGFSVGPEAAAWLDTHAFADEDGVLLRRVIDDAGRSKAFINGIAATVTQLRALGELLVDIHGQHAHQSLLKVDVQRQLLDSQAGLLDEAKAVAAAYETWRAAVRQREEFNVNASKVLLEREGLERQVEELEKLALKPGEWAEISNEHRRLSHAAGLIDAAQEALSAISESESPLLSQLSLLTQKLGRLTDVDTALEPVMEALEQARIQLQEAAYALNDYLGRVELDPARLQQVEGRLEAMYSMARKFRITPEDLPQEHEKLAQALRQLVDAGDLDALRVQEEKWCAAYTSAAQTLSQGRAKAAQALSAAVTAAMQELSMVGGRFSIALTACDPAAYGMEQVDFLVAGHAGVALRSLAKVASGGELARIALAISVIASSATAIPTLIFDEVDSGIGGGVVEVVGCLFRCFGQDC